MKLIPFVVILLISALSAATAAPDVDVWHFVNLGGNTADGSAKVNEATQELELKTRLPGFSTNGDAISFLYQQVQGDFDLALKLRRVEGAGWCGIALRDGLGSSAHTVFVGINENNEVGAFASGKDFQKAFGYKKGDAVFLRITRAGTKVTASVSQGSEWIKALIVTISEGGEDFIGMANSSVRDTSTAIYSFVDPLNIEAAQAKSEGTVEIAQPVEGGSLAAAKANSVQASLEIASEDSEKATQRKSPGKLRISIETPANGSSLK